MRHGRPGQRYRTLLQAQRANSMASPPDIPARIVARYTASIAPNTPTQDAAPTHRPTA